MVATFGPASYNFDETITTLRYANRAKNIKNKPKINEDPKDAMLRQFQDEINKLKAILDGKGGKRSKKGRRRHDEDGNIIEEGPDDSESKLRIYIRKKFF